MSQMSITYYSDPEIFSASLGDNFWQSEQPIKLRGQVDDRASCPGSIAVSLSDV